MVNKPFFSIVTPSYNRAHTLTKTIESVLNQDFINFELIVVDDGSQDQTEEVVSNIKDERIRYFYQENRERGAARNLGISKAKGAYVTFLDSDDVLYSNYLSHAYELIEKQHKVKFLHTAYEIVDTKGNIIRQKNSRKRNPNEQLIYGNSLSCLGIFIKQEILLENPFHEDRKLSGSEDYELWLRLASLYPIYYSSKITAALIQHDQRSVTNYRSDQLILRINLVIQLLCANSNFMAYYGHQKHIFVAHRYLYLSLHLVMSKHYSLGLKYWFKAIKIYPKVLLSHKTLGIFKNILIKH